VNVTAAAPAPAKALDSHASGNHVSENSSASQSTSQATNALLAVVVFLGAFLLFSVQLLLGKYILPWFGGTAGVWATCLFFFQTTLLAGYGYAHGSVGRFSLRLQTRVHIAVLVVSLVLMAVAGFVWPSPITPGSWWKPHSGEIAVLLILRLLLVSVGAAVTVLATTGPLMQHWFSRMYPGKSPYRLYALSNAGSLLGLLSYPLAMERWLRLNTQAWLWCGGFAVYALATIALAVKMSGVESPLLATSARSGAPGSSADLADDASSSASSLGERSAAPTLNTKLQWFGLSALGSLMLLAISRFITADLAPVPLLWMLPLAVYLLSFVICFDHPRWYRQGVFHPLLLAAALFTLTFYRGLGLGLWVFIAGFLVTEFACCMFCHGELFRRRPQAEHLTSFYLMIALGGVAGSAFVNLVAPFIFLGNWEMHLGISASLVAMAAIATMDKSSWANRKNPFIAAALGAWIILAACFWLSGDAHSLKQFLSHGVWSVVTGVTLLLTAMAVRAKGVGSLLEEQAPKLTRGSLFTAVAAASLVLIWAGTAQYRQARWAHRNFYGTLYVSEKTMPDSRFNANVFTHSSTLHGLQFENPQLRAYPTTYYNKTSGIGLLLMNFPRHGANGSASSLRFGGIGLGAGTLATYAQTGDVFRFYEIDPEVVSVASGKDGYFSYLSDSKAHVELVDGDGRISMERELAEGKPQGYDIFVVDAFNGDAVPVHLLTQEAFELYMKHLRDERSVIAVHITNRAVELASVVAAEAQHFGLNLLYVNAPGVTNQQIPDEVISPNQWILLSRSKDALSAPALVQASKPLHLRKGLHFWTDDQNNLLQILR
jgi:hypothetical protein